MLKKLNIKKLNKKGFTTHFLDRNMNINLKDIKKSTGFSLLEVMIAVAIITAGILGVFGLIVKTTAVGSISNNEVIASNLAQEGIEVVRNIRDTNWLYMDAGIPGAKWDDNIKGVGNERGGIVNYDSQDMLDTYFNPPPADINDCILSGLNCRLKINAGVYSHKAGGVDVDFYRLILLEKTPFGSGDDELKVISQVKWTERGQSRIITIEDRLFDWK